MKKTPPLSSSKHPSSRSLSRSHSVENAMDSVPEAEKLPTPPGYGRKGGLSQTFPNRMKTGSGTINRGEKGSEMLPIPTGPSEDVEELRKKMEEQIRIKNQRFSPRLPWSPSSPGKDSTTSQVAESSEASPLNTGIQTASTESTRTVRASLAPANQSQAVETPSYPFPRQLAQRMSSYKQPLGTHKPFTMLSPTTQPLSRMKESLVASDRLASDPNTPASDRPFAPPGDNIIRENDPNFPAPNLFDSTLDLTAEPGLEAWFTSLVDIFQENFKAQRVTLAIPADALDPQNVPWSQKASFNMMKEDDISSFYHSSIGAAPGLHSEDAELGRPRRSAVPSSRDASTVGRPALSPGYKASELGQGSLGSLGSLGTDVNFMSQRPAIKNRHSYAGVPGARHLSLRAEQSPQPMRSPAELTRTKSHVSGLRGPQEPILVPQTPGPKSHIPSEQYEPSSTGKLAGASDEDSTGARPTVFAVDRDLETEVDPLIDRKGIVRVLGKEGPVVFTRDYAVETTPEPAHAPDAPSAAADETGKGKGKGKGPGPGPGPASAGGHRSRTFSHLNAQARQNLTSNQPRLIRYEEYEQAPPSPWSQSPAPSPAARVDPDESPFFIPPKIDEEAFASSPPPHDYSEVQPLQAIGLERAVTIVHIPLVRLPKAARPSEIARFQLHMPGPDGGHDLREATPCPQRTPVGIVSFLAPFVPYPSNLRHALAQLAPILTNTFCQAKAFSDLEAKQLSHGNVFAGLGGQFSDDRRRMQSVASLAEELYNPDSEATRSTSSSITSPSEHSNLSKVESPGESPCVTPGDRPARNIPSNPEASGGYFSYQKGKETRAAPLGAKVEAKSQHTRLHSQGARLTATYPTVESANVPFPTSAVTSTISPARRSSLSTDFSRSPETTLTGKLAQIVLDFLPLQIFLAEPNTGKLTWINAKFLAFQNQPKERVLDTPWLTIHPSEREAFLSAWNDALQAGTQYSLQLRLKRYNNDKDYRWFHFRASPMLNKRGGLMHWVGTLSDIHSQHEAEAEAAREKQAATAEMKYRSLANSSPQIVFAAEAAEGLIFANKQWQAYSGQTSEEAMGFGFLGNVHPDDLRRCHFPSSAVGPLYDVDSSSLASPSQPSSSNRSETSDQTMKQPSPRTGAAEGGLLSSVDQMPSLAHLAKEDLVKIYEEADGKISFSTEVRLKNRQGDYRWHLVRVVKVDAINFGNGEASWYGTCTDINDHKLLEQQLKENMENNSNFLSTMSHELRTPLNGITGMIQHLVLTSLDYEQMEMCETIQNSSANLSDLIDNIMNLSKIEAGMLVLDHAPFDVRELIEDVNNQISSRAIEKRLEINYGVDREVPRTVTGDRFRIRQVLINLVGNAVKFTTSGGVYIHCGLHQEPSAVLKENQKSLFFEVCDTGKGFSEEQSKLLFKKFSQIAGSNTRAHGGSGLGLVISQKLVELHGGAIGAKSTPGQGSTFSFNISTTLPNAADRPPSPPPASPWALPPRKPSAANEERKSSAFPKEALEQTRSRETSNPTPITMSPGRDSPAYHSSASSTLSVLPRSFSMNPSERSSFSSVAQGGESGSPINLTMPATLGKESTTNDPSAFVDVHRRASLRPPLYSVLIVCPDDQTRKAIRAHLEDAMPTDVPRQITARASVEEGRDMIHGEDSVIFTHVIINLKEVNDILSFVAITTENHIAPFTSLVVITDYSQKRDILATTQGRGLQMDAKLKFVYKPITPSRLARIFESGRPAEGSFDRPKNKGAEELDHVVKWVRTTVGDKGHRILVVEDNPINAVVSFRNNSQSSSFSIFHLSLLLSFIPCFQGSKCSRPS